MQSPMPRLDQQLYLMQPPAEPKALPAAADVWAWVDEMAAITNAMIKADKDR